jgi:6-pyruvoyltetrahydropterin/6-carboxytetrahydropterin synthase
MLETFLEFTFEAAHTTPPYTRPHGHSFRAKVVLRGAPDPVYGWSHDLTKVEPVIEAVRRELDHKYLNDIEGLAMPTLENVARWIWQRLEGTLAGLDQVVVRRGVDGHVEGCAYRGPKRKAALRSRAGPHRASKASASPSGRQHPPPDASLVCRRNRRGGGIVDAALTRESRTATASL